MNSARSLVRGLKLRDATALVVGTVIGTGVFLKTAPMAQNLPSPLWVLLVWVASGALSLCGALTYAELSARFPQTGGEYAFLKSGYGSMAAFLYGWMRFWIASPGSIAAYAAGAATFALGGSKPAALALVGIFTLINCMKVKTAGGFQTALTLLKALLVYGLAAGILLFSQTLNWDLSLSLNADDAVNTAGGLRGFGMAMIAALWAYDGWNNAPMVAEEVEQPEKNLPYALIGGMALIGLTYLLVNYAYCATLSWQEVVTSNSNAYPDALPVATRAAQGIFGSKATFWLSVAFAVSAVGGMHASILTGARVPFAMARDGLFFRKLAEIHPTTHVPMWSVLGQGLVSAILVMSGSFDQLTDYVVFSSWVFYALVATIVFRVPPDAVKRFRVPRWIPMIFVGVSLLLIVNTLWSAPVQSLTGVILILLGVPFYFFFRSRTSRN